MYLKKIATRALVLGMVAVAAMATNSPIDWQSSCTDAAIVATWPYVRNQLTVMLPAAAQFIG
ncbi:hypothetical protein GGI21_003487, partial [Coemansia aciculifera]